MQSFVILTNCGIVQSVSVCKIMYLFCFCKHMLQAVDSFICVILNRQIHVNSSHLLMWLLKIDLLLFHATAFVVILHYF